MNKLYRAKINKITATEVEFMAPADASPEELAQYANDADDAAIAAHEGDDMDEYPHGWRSYTRSKVASVDLVEDEGDDDGQPSEAQEWHDFDPEC
jgi:hypothetical protein